MADSFFDLDTTLGNGENFIPPDSDEDCLENEEEYDALNDETFGAIEDVSSLDDWEQQHEQFAIAESSKTSGQLEKSLSQRLIDDCDRLSLSSSVWSYTPTPKNGDKFNTSSLQNSSKSLNNTQGDKSFLDNSGPLLTAQPKKICTVEELEKSLLNSSRNALPTTLQGQQPRPLIPPPGHHQGLMYHPMIQQQMPNTRIPPPGLRPMGIPPPGMHHLNPGVLPPGMLRMVPPHFQYMQANGLPRPPGFMYPPGSNPNQFPANHHYNYPPPVRNFNNMPQALQARHPMPQQLSAMQQQQRQRNLKQQQQQQQKQRNGNGNNGRVYPGDDHVTKNGYSGMMTMREKQWLLNIQMLQLNTSTPYFDDYYYTIFKEKKIKSNKENINDKNSPHQKRQHRNSERQENQLTPKVYTPLQFENSLGKLQCGSVTAPRKIIDMDIMTTDKDGDGSQVSREVRRTKQLLLELEALYALLLKAEDINNPMFISNSERLREIKQKQRLRELDLAQTPEQKQEILRLFKLESETIEENQYDYIVRVVQGLLQEDKFNSFLNIRKGKMLTLRVLTHLTMDMFPVQLVELWNRILLSLPLVGRRDTAGDNILPKFYPYFKRFIQTRNMSDIFAILHGLMEIVKQENHRSTPSCHVGKPSLHFVLLNKFGVSALVSVLIRVELLLTTATVAEKHLTAWSAFLANWAQQTETVSKIAAPIEFVPSHLIIKHCDRLEDFKESHKAVLVKNFAEPDREA